MFGNYRYAHVNYYEDQTAAFHRFFIKVLRKSAQKEQVPTSVYRNNCLIRIRGSKMLCPDPELKIFYWDPLHLYTYKIK